MRKILSVAVLLCACGGGHDVTYTTPYYAGWHARVEGPSATWTGSMSLRQNASGGVDGSFITDPQGASATSSGAVYRFDMANGAFSGGRVAGTFSMLGPPPGTADYHFDAVLTDDGWSMSGTFASGAFTASR